MSEVFVMASLFLRTERLLIIVLPTRADVYSGFLLADVRVFLVL